MFAFPYLKNIRSGGRSARPEMSSIFKFLEVKNKAIYFVCIIVNLTLNLRSSLTLHTYDDQLGMAAVLDLPKLPDLPDLPDFKFVTPNITNNQVTFSKDPWTVVVIVSQGFDDMFRNWWYYYSKLNLTNMKVVMLAEDSVTFAKYSNQTDIDVWNTSFQSQPDSAVLNYDTPSYKKLVSRRPRHLRRILKVHPNIIYTDIDTVWLRDPRPYISGEYDFAGGLDDVIDGNPYYCTGFLVFRDTASSKRLLRTWQLALEKQNELNQPIFNRLVLEDKNARGYALSRLEFPSGDLYFDENEQEGVVVVHNNFIQGKDKKIRRFQRVGLWMEDEEKKKNVPFWKQITSQKQLLIKPTDANKTSIAIVTCTTAKQLTMNHSDFTDLSIVKFMLPSLLKTINLDDTKIEYHLFVGIDDDDYFWLDPHNQERLQDLSNSSILPIHFHSFPSIPNRIPFNLILQIAKDYGADYFVRINDDSEFVTNYWAQEAMQVLQSFEPPNVGVVGPTCEEGNTEILTHDMVHKTHMDIFCNEYYPEIFDNWFLDDWISKVYGEKRTKKLESWTMKHHIDHHGTRYKAIDFETGQTALFEELRKGRKTIKNWLISRFRGNRQYSGETPAIWIIRRIWIYFATSVTLMFFIIGFLMIVSLRLIVRKDYKATYLKTGNTALFKDFRKGKKTIKNWLFSRLRGTRLCPGETPATTLAKAM